MYNQRDRQDRRIVIILAIAGWVLALAVGVAFVWWALAARGSPADEGDADASPTIVATSTPSPTATATATATPTREPSPTSAPPTSPLPTPAPPTPTPLPTGTLTAGADGANVRAGPDTSFDLLGSLDPGQTAPILGTYEDWFLTEYEGEPAWIASWVVEAADLEYVPGVDEAGVVVATPAGPQPTPAGTLTVGDNGANVRSGPDTDYDLLGSLDPGATAPVTGKSGDWFRIDYEGQIGWVAGWIVEVAGAEGVPEVEVQEGLETMADDGPPATQVGPTPEPSLRTEFFVVQGAPGPFAAGDEIPFSYRVVNLTDAALEFRTLGTWAQETDELFESVESVEPDPALGLGPGEALEGTGTIRLTQVGTYTLWLYMVLDNLEGLPLSAPATVTIGD